MRKAALISLALAVAGAGAFALTATAGGGSSARSLDVSKTARAKSVHYAVDVTLVKGGQPFVLHIAGGASRDNVAVHLRLDSLTLKDGTQMPGTTGALLMSRPFLYERAPSGIAVLGNVRWLRLPVVGLRPRSQLMSTVQSLTPAPLLRVVAESKLHPAGAPGRYAGTAAYDDPVVLSALRGLTAGTEFRSLHVSVVVGSDDLIHAIAIRGRTADGSKRFALHARLFAFGTAVHVVPPRPGTFMDEQLMQLQS